MLNERKISAAVEFYSATISAANLEGHVFNHFSKYKLFFLRG